MSKSRTVTAHGIFNINIGIPLLDYYSSIKKEYTDKEIYEREYGERIQCIIGQMIAENEFTNDTLSVKEIEKKGKYFEKNFEEYVISEEYLVMLEAMERVNTNGEIDWKSMEEIIACANMHPENGLIQLIAVNYGTTYKIDGGKHYEGTAECIERVVDIFSKERDKVVEADKEIYKWAIDNLLELGYYEQALSYVEKLIQVDGENEENILLAAYCKYNLGLNKECIEIVNQLPEDNYYKLYYKAASLIQEGNNQEALKEMEKLSEIVESNVSDKGDIDTLLYGLVQQVVIRDWTPAHQYGFYKPESEEYVVENEMLRLYLDAMYYMYQDKQYEQAEQAIESLLKKDSELKQVSYLAGVIHMEKGEYEEAIRYLEEVIEANPEHKAALRVISHVYDMKGDYETAYEYALRIKELIPSTDHNFDIYGVGYHNNQLLLQIERELGVER